MCLPLHQYHIGLDYCCLIGSVKSGSDIPLILFFFSKIVLVILVPLPLHVNYRIGLSVSTENFAGPTLQNVSFDPRLEVDRLFSTGVTPTQKEKREWETI